MGVVTMKDVRNAERKEALAKEEPVEKKAPKKATPKKEGK